MVKVSFYKRKITDFAGTGYEMERKGKITVTIITGFLGAGKTTFINSLLNANRDKKFALVENEFGDVSIDTKLIKGLDASQMFELKKGCICCTISDEYELVLQELVERFPNVSHLLIETTGVAEPSSVIRPFLNDQNLKKIYSYNGTICIVDAINYWSQPEKETSVKQIAAADWVVINKTENISINEIENLVDEVEQLNPFCSISKGGLNNLVPKNLLDRMSPQDRSGFDFTNIQNHLKLEAKTITCNHPIKKEEFTQWLSYNLDVFKNEIYRIKGILYFKDEAFEHILQGVGGSFEILESERFVDVKTVSKIIFIGRLNNANLSFNFT